jgi:hypothetical protein
MIWILKEMVDGNALYQTEESPQRNSFAVSVLSKSPSDIRGKHSKHHDD